MQKFVFSDAEILTVYFETKPDMVIEAERCLDGFGLIMGYIGNGLMEIFSRWMKQAV
jgi:hypothetical protein